MNNVSKTIAASAVLLFTLAGCSQQQVSGDSSQVAGSSQQVAGSSQQVAGSSQQVSPEDIAKNCPACNAPKVEAVPSKPQVVASGHTHPANKCTKSIRHNHPNGSRSHSHKYSCTGTPRGNRWTHGHPANKCTKSIRHTHKYNSANHSHKYSCKGGVDIQALQAKLKAKGYYKGPINGVINSGTRSALQRYQQRRH